MLSRAVSAIRGTTLIVNLPGSPKAARENLSFIIQELRHGLGILSSREGDCAQS
jgi:molybdopterin biosynthesis enzyme MoaB